MIWIDCLHLPGVEYEDISTPNTSAHREQILSSQLSFIAGVFPGANTEIKLPRQAVNRALEVQSENTKAHSAPDEPDNMTQHSVRRGG
jgi:hypothetical protein